MKNTYGTTAPRAGKLLLCLAIAMAAGSAMAADALRAPFASAGTLAEDIFSIDVRPSLYAGAGYKQSHVNRLTDGKGEAFHAPGFSAASDTDIWQAYVFGGYTSERTFGGGHLAALVVVPYTDTDKRLTVNNITGIPALNAAAAFNTRIHTGSRSGLDDIEIGGRWVYSPLPANIAGQVGRAYLRALGISTSDADALVQLRRMPLKALINAQGEASEFYAQRLARLGGGMPPFSPVADGTVIPGGVNWRGAMQAAAGKLDVMLGTNRHEAAAFVYCPPPGGGWRTVPGTLRSRVLGHAVTARVFRAPALAWARAASVAGRAVYLYRFDWAPADAPLGAVHCIGLPFVFGTSTAFHTAPMLDGADAAEVEALSRTMRASWSSFVRDGQPATQSLPSWPQFTACEPGMRLRR